MTKPTKSIGPRGSDLETFPKSRLDDSQFQSLYEQFNRPLYNFFANRGFSREESRDLVQETFLAAYDGRAQFRGESAPAWLFGIATNIWRMRLRDTKRKKRDAQVLSLDSAIDSEPSFASHLSDSSSSLPLERHLADERLRILHEALRELPERARLCVVLQLRGYKYREIADILQVSLNTIRSQLFDARVRLGEIMRERSSTDSDQHRGAQT